MINERNNNDQTISAKELEKILYYIHDLYLMYKYKNSKIN